MTTRSDDIRPVSMLGFLLTYHCPISCAHCMVEAGPRRKEKMALGSVLGWIDEAAAYHGGAIEGIDLTGGEPFYDLQNLALVSDHAAQAGLAVSVETNAGWAGTLEEAILTLNQLPAIGKLSVSTGVHHREFIPTTHIINAVIAAKLLGRNYEVTIATDCVQDGPFRSIREQLERVVDPSRIRNIATYPAGRGKNPDAGLRFRSSGEPAEKPCANPFRPMILPDGRVMACSGPVHHIRKSSCPLCLGNLRKEPLEAVLDRTKTNRLLHLVWSWGPHRMNALLSSCGHELRLPKEYLCGSPCDICNKLLSDRYLVSKLDELLADPANIPSPRRQMRQLNSEEMLRQCGCTEKANFDPATLLRPSEF